MTLNPLPTVADHYIWLLQSAQQTPEVDPADAQPDLDCLLAQDLQLQGILITHTAAEPTSSGDRLCKQTVAPAFGAAGETMHEPVCQLTAHGAVGAAFGARCACLFEGTPAHMLSCGVGRKRTIKPFLRSETPTVVASVTRFDARGVHCDGVLATLRRWKHQFT